MSEPSPAKPVADTSQRPPVVVKKYANRRLYNTESSSYITLDNLAGMIRLGRDFVVYDAKSGEDITRGVLTQIIVEEESKGRAMLPTAFLRQIIGFYGDSLQQFVPSYLENAMSSFAVQQEQMRSAMQQTVGTFFPVNMQEVGRQNMAMMERAMSLFAPFYRPPGQAAASASEEPGQGSASPALDQSARIQQLQEEVEALRAKLAATESLPAADQSELLRQQAEIAELQEKLAAALAPRHGEVPHNQSEHNEHLLHEVESLRLQLAATRAAAVESQAYRPGEKRPVRKPGTVKPPGALQ